MMLQKWTFLLAVATIIPCILSARLYHSAGVYKDDPLYKICSKDSDKKLLELKEVSIKPSPPKKGETVKLNITISLREEVTSGEVKVSLSYGAIPIVDETLDLCDLVTQINTQCPLKKGDLSISTKEDIPDYIPNGKYSGKITLTDQNGDEMLCLELNLNLN